MKKTEMIHFLGFLFSLIITIVFGLARNYRFFIWMSLINLLLNLYPVLLQRYNRNRIQRVLIKYYPH